MIYRLPPLNALRVFEVAARHLSFKEAAQELSITQAAVSHQIKSLEEYLGMELFRRVGRGVQLTEAARACLPKLREGFESLAAAVELIRERAAETELLITAPPVFTARWLFPRLADFAKREPRIELRVFASSKMVDGSRGPHFSSNILSLEAASQKLGVALALKPLVNDDIESGRLCAPFKVEVKPHSAYFLVCPEVIAERPAVAAFRKWLLDQAVKR